MPQQTINDGETGLAVRTKLNEMFGELYGNTTIPMKLIGISGNATLTIPGNTFVASIEIAKVSGTPVLKIGTTPGGQDIFGETTIDGFNMTTVQSYFSVETILYLTLSGGAINVRADVINQYF